MNQVSNVSCVQKWLLVLLVGCLCFELGCNKKESDSESGVYQPPKQKITLNSAGMPQINNFDEAAWILSKRYKTNQKGFDMTNRHKIVASRWLNSNNLDSEQQKQAISVMTPYFTLSAKPTINERNLRSDAYRVIEKYGDKNHVELVAGKMGSDRDYPQPEKVMAWIAANCEGTKSDVVIDYLFKKFERYSRSENDEKELKVVEEGLVSIGKPVLTRHGKAIDSKNDFRFERLAMRLAKLTDEQAANQCVSNLDKKGAKREYAIVKLRELKTIPSIKGEIENGLISKINGYTSGTGIRDSGDQNAVISMAALLAKWGTAQKSLPVIATAIEKAQGRCARKEDYDEIVAFASKSGSPVAADVYIAMLAHSTHQINAVKINPEQIEKALTDMGKDAEDSVLSLINLKNTRVSKMAGNLIQRYKTDQKKIINQCFDDLPRKGVNRSAVFKRLNEMEFNSDSQDTMIKRLEELKKKQRGVLSQLTSPIYFKWLGAQHQDKLIEAINGKISSYRYPAMKRLLQVAPEEGTKVFAELYKVSHKRRTYLIGISRNRDPEFEQALIPLLDLNDEKLSKDVINPLGTIGTSKSVEALKKFQESAENAKKKELAELAQSTIEKIQERIGNL